MLLNERFFAYFCLQLLSVLTILGQIKHKSLHITMQAKLLYQVIKPLSNKMIKYTAFCCGLFGGFGAFEELSYS
jgi:hypothetical protein